MQVIEAVGLPLASDEAGVDGFIIFADTNVGAYERFARDKPQLQGANVTRRDLIDLGYGIDESFEDIVPA